MKLSAQIVTLEKLMKKKTAAIYARVSSQQQKDEETIKSQVDILCKFATDEGFEVVNDLIFLDEGYSGASLDRPGLDNLRDFVREYPINAIFVYSPDRLSRKYAFQLILDEEFRKFGVQLIFFKGRSQAKTSEDHMLTHFQGIFAEYERAQILDRTRRGKLYKARQGDVRILAQAPFGYNNERDASFYTIKENQAQIVREIFHWFTKEGLKMRQIALRLEEKEVAAPKGGTRWDSSTISGILRNSAYIGTAYYGKTEKYEGKIDRTVRYKKRGKVTRPIKPKRTRSSDLWEPIPVPQIISENDFELAQELLKKNKERSGRNTKTPSLMQGLLLCGICGNSYYKKTRGKSSSHYTCRSHLVKHLTKCGNRILKQSELDRLVWDNVIELLKNPSLIEKEISRRCDDSNDIAIQQINKAGLEKEIKLIEKSYNKLLDAYQEGDCLTLDDLRERSKKLKEREKVLRKELESLEAFIVRKESHKDFARTLEMFKEKLNGSFENLSVQEKQKVTRMLIEDVVVFSDSLEIRHKIPIFESENGLLCGDLE